MAIHFSESELSERRQAACRAMAERGLHGLALFRQESMDYLTGTAKCGAARRGAPGLSGNPRETEPPLPRTGGASTPTRASTRPSEGAHRRVRVRLLTRR